MPNQKPVEVQSAFTAATGEPTVLQNQQNILDPKNIAPAPIPEQKTMSQAMSGIGSAEQSVPKADYFKLKLSGMKDDDIFQMASTNNAIVNVRDSETIWKDYGNEVYKGDRALFDQQYKQVSNEYEGYKKLTIDTYAPTVSDFDLIDKRPVKTTLSDPTHPDFYKKDAFDLSVVGPPKGMVVDSQGYWKSVKSQGELADEKGAYFNGKFYPTDTFEGLGNFYVAYMKDLYDRKIAAGEDAGFYDPILSLTRPFETKRGDSLPNLVLDYTDQGEAYWKPVDPHERIKGSEIRSAWGPRSLYNNTVGDFIGSFANSFILNIPSIFGSLGSSIGEGVKAAGATDAGNWMIDKGNLFQNLSSQVYFQESENQLRGQESTLSREVGGAVGMIVQAWLSGGVAAEMTALKATSAAIAAEGTAGLTFSQIATNAARQALLANRAAQINRVFFAATMADGFNQGSKEAGIDPGRAAMTYGASFAASWMLIGAGERLFGFAGSPHGVGLAWRSVFGDVEAMTVAKQSSSVIKETLQKTALSLGKPVSQLTNAEVEQATRSSMLNLFGKVKTLPKAGFDFLKNPSRPIISHMTTASAEMSMIHIANNAITMSSDFIGNDEEDVAGNGLYGTENLFSGLGHSFLTGLAMGAFSGGVQKYQQYKDPQLKAQNRTAMDFIMSNRQSSLYSSLDKLHKQSWFGSDTIEAATGRTIEKGAIDPETGKPYVTMNDIGYETAVKSVKAVETVYETSGIREWHQKVKADKSNPNSSYMKDAFDRQFSNILKEVIDVDTLAKDTMEMLIEKDSIERELQRTDLDGAEKSKMEKRLKKISDLTGDFLETVKLQNETKTRQFSDIEGKIIRDGLVKSRYLYDVEAGKFSPNVIKRLGIAEFPMMVSAAQVDNINKTAATMVDSTKLAEMRAANNQATIDLFNEAGTIKSVNSELLKKVQDLHNNHLLAGIAPGERQSVENFMALMAENSQNDYQAIIGEIASKYGIELSEMQNEDLADNVGLKEILDDVYTRASGKDPEARQIYGAKVGLMKDFDSMIERMQSDKSGIYAKGEKTVHDILNDVYTSINAGTPEEPLLISIPEILKGFKSSDLSNPSDVAKLDQVITDLAEKSEFLKINNESFGKLNDKLSKLTENTKISDKDASGSTEGSIYYNVEKLFNEALELKSKAGDISAEARKIFDAKFVEQDTAIRLSNVIDISDWVDLSDSNGDVREGSIAVRADIAKAIDISKQMKGKSERYIELSEKATKSGLNESEAEEIAKVKNELIDLAYQEFAVVNSAEHKLHEIFNSKSGDKIFKSVSDLLENTLFETKKNRIITGGSSAEFPVTDESNRVSYYDAGQYQSSLNSKSPIEKAYAYNHFVAHLNNIKRLSTKSFYSVYHDYITKMQLENPDFVAPTFEQQRAIQHAVSFLVSPDFLGSKTAEGSKIVFNEKMLAVLGFAGTGKTRITMPFIMDIYSGVKAKVDAENGVEYKQPVFLLTAPHVRQRDNMRSVEKNVKSKNVSIHDLDVILEGKVDAFKSKEDVVVIIDESSELTKAQVTKLRELNESTGAKIIGLADDGQISGDASSPYSKFLIGTERTVTISDIHRTGVYDIVRLQQIYRESKLDGNGKRYVIYSNTQYIENSGGISTRGVRLRGNEISSRKQQTESFVNDLNSKEVSQKTALVVSDDNQRNAVVSELIAKGIDKNMAESSVYALYSNQYTAKGLQFDRVYVNLDSNAFGGAGSEYYKAMLTAVSRGISYVDVITELPSAMVHSEKVESLITDSNEYLEKSRVAYKQYAADQPNIIKGILDGISDSGVKKVVRKQSPAPTADPNNTAGTAIPTIGNAAATSQAQQQSTNSATVVNKKPSSTYVEVKEGAVKDRDGNSVSFGESVIDPSNGNQFYVTGIKTKNGKGRKYVEITDQDGKSSLITESKFRKEYSIFKEEDNVEIDEIYDSLQSQNSKFDRFDTVVKNQHGNSSSGNTRVSTMFLQGSKESSKQRERFLPVLNSKNPEVARKLKKIFVSETKDGFTNNIYNAVDTTGFTPEQMTEYFGTPTPELIDGKYFVFGMEYHVDGFEKNVSLLSNAILEASASNDPEVWKKAYYDIGGSSKAGRQEDINLDRFIDRVVATKKAFAENKWGPDKAVELSGISINKITQGNTVFGSKDVSFEQLTANSPYNKGYYKVEMNGKTVYMSRPHLIYDLKNSAVKNAASIVMYKDVNGTKKFEPGYYMFITFDPNNSSNRMMVKMKSRPYSKDEAVSFFKDYVKKQGNWNDPAFFDEINRIINANRYFIERNGLTQYLNSKDRISSIDGRKFSEYRIEVLDQSGKIDVKATFERINQFAGDGKNKGLIEKAYALGDSPLTIPMRNFPPGNPDQLQAGKMTFDNAKTLNVNLEDVHWPQIVATDIPLQSVSGKGKPSNKPYDLNFSIDSNKSTNMSDLADLVAQVDGHEDVTEKELSRDAKARRIHILEQKFGSSDQANKIRSGISRRIFDRSVGSNIIAKDYGNKTYLEAIEEVYNEIKEAASHNTRISLLNENGDTIEKDVADLTWNDVIINNNNEKVKSSYIYHQLALEEGGFRPVYDVVIKSIFDNVILGTDKELIHVTPEQMTEGEENLTGTSSMHKNGEHTDPIKSFSAYTRFVISSQKIYDFTHENTTGEISDTGKTMSPKEVMSIISEISQNHKLLGPGKTNFDVVSKSLKEYMLSSKREDAVIDDRYNTIASIYYAFFHKGEGNPLDRYSYYEIVSEPDRVFNESYLNDPEITREIINSKSATANSILSDIFSATYSKDSRLYSNTVSDFSTGDLNRIEPRRNTASEIKARLKESMIGKIYDRSVAGAVMRQSAIDSTQALYRVEYMLESTGVPENVKFMTRQQVENLMIEYGSGIQFRNAEGKTIKSPLDQDPIEYEGYRSDENGVSIIDRSGKKKKFITKTTNSSGQTTYSFEGNSNSEILNNIQGVLKFLGINKEISVSTINAYLNEIKVDINKYSTDSIELPITKSSLAEILYSGIDSIIRPEKYKEIGKEEDVFVNEDAEEGETFSQSEAIGDGGYSVSVMPFYYRQDLATVEAFIRGGSENRFHKGVEGQAIYTTQQNNDLINKFGSSKIENQNLIERTADYFLENLAVMKESAYILPNINQENAVILNPIYDRNYHDFAIEYMSLNSGIKRGFAGKNVNRMTPREITKDRIEAGFINKLVKMSRDGSLAGPKNKNAIRYQIPHPAIGDPGNTYYFNYLDVDGRSNPILISDYNKSEGRQGSAKVNWDYFAYSLLRGFEMKRRQQAIAQDQLLKALSSFSQGSEQYANIPEFRLKSDAIIQRLNDPAFRAELFDKPEIIQEFIDSMSMNPADKQSLKRMLESTIGISVNSHYTIDKEGNIKLGKLVDFRSEEDSFFTRKNYSDIISELQGVNISDLISSGNENKRLPKEVTEKLKPLFKHYLRGKMMRFVNYMFNNDISAARKTVPFFNREGEPALYKTKRYTKEEWSQLSEDQIMEIGDRSYILPTGKSKDVLTYEMNPFYEAYYLSFMNHSLYMLETTMGTPAQYKNYAQIPVRAHSMLTPGAQYTIKQNGIGVHRYTNVGIYDDSSFQVRNSFAKLFSSSFNDKTDGVDGMEVQVGIEGVLRRYSLGPNQIKSDARHYKEIENHTNPVSGMKLLIKSSTLDLRAMRGVSSYWENMERKMLSANKFEDPDTGKMTTMYDKLVEFNMDDEALAVWMFDGSGRAKQVKDQNGNIIDIRHTYISRNTPLSAAKLTGGNKMMDIEANEYSINDAATLDYQNRMMVLDLNKDARNQNASTPTQMMQTMNIGENNFDRVVLMKSSSAELAKEVNSRVNNYNQDDLKQLLIDQSYNIHNAGNRVQIANDKRFSIHLPLLRDSIRSLHAKEINEGIKPRFESGGAFVQYPGDAVDVYHAVTSVPELGIIAGDRFNMRSFAKRVKLLESKGIDPKSVFELDANGEIARHGLSAMRAYVRQGEQLIDIESKEYLYDKLDSEQKAVFDSGEMPKLNPDQIKMISQDIINSGGHIDGYEVVVPFTKYEDFGFSNNPLHEFFYKKYDYDDILTIQLEDGNILRYDRLGDNADSRMKAFASLLGEGDMSKLSLDTLALRVLDEANVFEVKKEKETGDEYIDEKDVFKDVFKALVEYYEGFLDAHDYVINRVPSSTSASGFRGKAIGFAHEASNSIFVSAKKNVIDNSDFDIDELHAYSSKTGKYGRIITDSDKSSHAKNAIIRNMRDYYSDPNNIQSMSEPVSVDNLKVILENIDPSKKQAFKKLLYDVTTDISVEDMFNAGVETPGIFANGLKVYSNIYHSLSKETGIHFTPVRFNGKEYSRFFEKTPDGRNTGIDIMSDLASFLQAAVDNGKEGILGELGANPTTAPMIIGLRSIGVPKEEIIGLLKDREVSNVIKDITQGRNIDFSNKNKNQVFNSWISVLNSTKNTLINAINGINSTSPENATKMDMHFGDALNAIDALASTIKIRTRFIPKEKVSEVIDDPTEGLVGMNGAYMEGEEGLYSSFKRTKDATMIDQYDFNTTVQWIDNFISKIQDLETASILGDRLTSVAKIMAINQGIKQDGYKTYDYLKTLDELRNPAEYRKYLEKRKSKAKIFNRVTDVEIMSEYDIAVLADKKMDDFVKIDRILPKLPEIQEFIKSIQTFDRNIRKNILTEHQVFRAIDSEFLSDINMPRIYNEQFYDSLIGTRSKVLVSMYLERKGNIYSDTSNKYNINDKAVTGSIDISTREGQLEFIVSLHDLIRDMKSNPEKYEKIKGSLVDSNGKIINSFLDKVQVNAKTNMDEYLSVYGSGFMSDTEGSLGDISKLKDDMKSLKYSTGIDMEERLFLYNLITNGLEVRKGSMAEYVDAEKYLDYDNFLKDVHNSLTSSAKSRNSLSSEIKERYKDRIAVQMRNFIRRGDKLNNREENEKAEFNDFRLNVIDAGKDGFKYNGGIIPLSIEEFPNSGTKSIKDFPKYITYFTPISGKMLEKGSKRYRNVFKLVETEINSKSGERGMRYIRIDKKVSDMLGSWTVGGTAYEAFDNPSVGKTMHVISMKNINELNKGRTIVLSGNEVNVQNYTNGRYYIKTGQVVNVERVKSGSGYGLKIKLENTINPSLSAPFDPIETGNYSGVDFNERDAIIKELRQGSEEMVDQYMNSLSQDYMQVTDKTSILKMIRDKSLFYEQAVIADSILRSKISSKIASKGKFGVISFDASPDLMSKIKLPSWASPKMIAALHDNFTGDIYINSDFSQSPKSIAENALHEIMHDITVEEIDKYINGDYQDSNAEAFGKYMVDLYKHSKSILEKRGYTSGTGSDPLSKKLYGLENAKEFVSELISDKRFKEVMSTVPAMNPEVARMGVTTAWQEFMNVLKDFFFNIIKGAVKDNVIEEFLAVSSRYFDGQSVESLGSKIDRGILASPIARNIPESEVSRFSLKLSEREKRKTMTSDESRDFYYGSGKKVNKIKDSTDLIEAMVRYPVRDKYSDNNMETVFSQVMNRLTDNFRTHNEYYIKENGKTYKAKSLDVEEISRISREIISDKTSYDPIVKSEIISHLRKEEFKGLSEALAKNKKFIDNAFNVDPQDKVRLLSDAEEIFSSTGNFFDPTFNPVTISSEGKDGRTHISLIDVTTGSLFKKLTPNSNSSYLADYISKYSPELIENEQFKLLQTESGMRKFNLMLLALMIRSKNEKVVFDRVSVVKPTGNPESLSMYLPDYLGEMKAILSDKVIYDILPENIREIVDNPKTWENIETNYVASLYSMYNDTKERFYNDAQMGDASAKKKIEVYDSMISRLENKWSGTDIFKNDVERIIRMRMREIEDLNNGKESSIITKEEYIALSKALKFIREKGSVNTNKMSDIGTIGVFTKLSYNVSNPVAQMYVTDVLNAVETAKNNFMTHQKTMQSLLKNVNSRYLNSIGGVMDKSTISLFDTGYKRFDRMFIKTKAVNSVTGDLVDVNSFEIHYKLDDFIPERSKEALNKGLISKEELELGGYIVKSIKNAFINKLKSKGYNEAEALDYYNANWRDGMLPIMSRRASEKIFSKDFVNGIKQYMNKFSRSNDIFDYVNESNDNHPAYVTDMFMYQMGNTELGSADRMNMIGLFSNKEMNDRLEISGRTADEIDSSIKKNSSEVEQNLEVLMAYFMMNHFNKEALDPTMTTYYASQALLLNYESKFSDDPDNGGRMKNTREYLRRMNELVVKGKRRTLSGKDALQVQGKNANYKITADDALNSVGALSAVSIMGGNVFADTKNLLVGVLQLQSFAAANSLAGAKNFYGEKDIARAISTYTTNPRLAIALSNQYKMAGMDRSNFVNNQRHFITKNNVVSDHWLYIGQFGGDYLVRTLSLMAHMNKKGVLDAYSLDKEGKLVYDETKDARLYENGKITEEGKLIKMELLKNMKNEGLYDGPVDLDAKLPMAFDNRLRNSVKTITDKFIMGGAYDDATKVNLDAYSIGRMFLMFKRYILDKAQNLYAEGYESKAIGDYKVKEVTVDGQTEQIVDFEGDYMEGLVQSIMGIYRNCREIGKDKQYGNLVEMWKDQKDIRRMNLSRFAHDAALSAIFLALMPALLDDEDENHNGYWSSMMSSPIGKTMNYSFIDLMSSYRPDEYFGALNEPFFALQHLEKTAKFMAATVQMDTEQMDKQAEKTFGLYKTTKYIKKSITGE